MGWWWWWWWWLVSCDGQLLLLLLVLLLGIEEWVRESLTSQGRGERKKHKIINRMATVIVHICTVTITIVHKCTILHWVFFCSKCVKCATFSILQDFTHTNAEHPH